MTSHQEPKDRMAEQHRLLDFLELLKSEAKVRADDREVVLDLRRVQRAIRQSMVSEGDFRELRVEW